MCEEQEKIIATLTSDLKTARERNQKLVEIVSRLRARLIRTLTTDEEAKSIALFVTSVDAALKENGDG